MRTIGQPSPEKAGLVAFYGGPWDGVTLVARFPAPIDVCVQSLAPSTRRDGKPIALEPVELPEGSHHYHRAPTLAGYCYRYLGQL